MLSMKIFQDNGLKVIPDIGIIRDVDVDRWSDWIKREKCEAIFITIQTMSGKMTKTRHKIQVGNLIKLREKVGDDVRFIIQGASARKMPYFLLKLGNISFINHAAWVKAELRINAVTGEGLRDKGYSVQDTFDLNIRLLKSILYEARRTSFHQQMEISDGK